MIAVCRTTDFWKGSAQDLGARAHSEGLTGSALGATVRARHWANYRILAVGTMAREL